MRAKAIVLAALVLFLALPGAVLAAFSTNYGLPVSSISSGGGEKASTNFRLGDTVGEPVVGEMGSANLTLRIGYWYSAVGSRGATIDISVVLQGGARPNPAGWVVPLTVKFFPAGTANVMTATANYTFTQNTTKVGSTAVTNVTGITPGTYDITVKSAHTLLNVKTNVVISQPSTNVTVGTLLEGNADESNTANAGIINISDFTTLSASYGKSVGQSGYNAQADFDRNNTVNIFDFTLLSVNYNKSSPITVP